VEKRRQKQQILNIKRRFKESDCWRNWMLLMKILSLTMPHRKNLRRLLERKTRMFLLTPETIEERNSIAIIPPADMNMKSRSK
jgi:hypothetical protein